MRQLVFENSFVVPSNPEITRCPSQEGVNVSEPNLEDVSLTAIENGVSYKGMKVVAVLGPVACDQCAHKCPDAYVTIGRKHDVERAELVGVEFGDPVEIALLKSDVFAPKQPSSQQLTEAHYKGRGAVLRDIEAMSEIGSLSVFETEVVVRAKNGRTMKRESLASRGY